MSGNGAFDYHRLRSSTPREVELIVDAIKQYRRDEAKAMEKASRGPQGETMYND